MKIVCALDSFKGSMSSIEAGRAVEKGIRRVNSDAEITVLPLGDGGEGTLDALISCGGEIKTTEVTGPMGEKVSARYGIMNTGTAVIEMAEASGLYMVPEEKRNPLKATSRGTGDLILAALNEGCRDFVICIGGSATNDAGIGMLEALSSGSGEDGIRGFDNLDSRLRDCRFEVACDVTNPLTGPNGASFVFGPQKGADPEMCRILDEKLSKFADECEKKHPEWDRMAQGCGAAGGIGYSLKYFLNAEMKSGAELVIGRVGLDSALENADFLITGEGRIDGQTSMGKAPLVAAQHAGRLGIKTVAFGGTVEAENVLFDRCIGIKPEKQSLKEAMEPETAVENLASAAAKFISELY